LSLAALLVNWFARPRISAAERNSTTSNVFANEYIKKRARRAATRPDKPNRPASVHSLRQN